MIAVQQRDAPANVGEVVELEQREKIRMSFSDHTASSITRFAGSMGFFALNLVWFVGWIGIQVLGLAHFDSFPFGLLTMIVSLEAIFLSIFVLISANRQALLSDRRAKLDLQVNIIAEQEVTKLVKMVARLELLMGDKNGMDPEVTEMERPIRIEQIASQMEKLETEMDDHAAKTRVEARI